MMFCDHDPCRIGWCSVTLTLKFDLELAGLDSVGRLLWPLIWHDLERYNDVQIRWSVSISLTLTLWDVLWPLVWPWPCRIRWCSATTVTAGTTRSASGCAVSPRDAGSVRAARRSTTNRRPKSKSRFPNLPPKKVRYASETYRPKSEPRFPNLPPKK